MVDMRDYDFHILQPNEFECLTRDLLQKHIDGHVESFASGRDGGIDLRFAWHNETKAVVQVKHYKTFSSLKSNLNKEVDKVRLLNPSRYILSTSVGLTPNNKDEIMRIFDPYILDVSDILGRDDLNNLLGKYPDVEKQYYKLWLSSTVVLEHILDKRINTWSDIELEEIREQVSTYVMNDAFNVALSILKKNKYVIISGIPGIGKTTLSRILVYYLLSKGYDEFVKVDSVDDAVQKLCYNKKQVFFYDDFLGSSYLSNNEHRFDKKLVQFIDKIKREEDKIFILSTREYILADAMLKYEIFALKHIELSKCVLDLSYYSEDIRAEILYNHLAVAQLPYEYVKAIVNRRKYMGIVKHKNFNPRIIETFLNKNYHNTMCPDEYVSAFLSSFDKPFAVWERTFTTLNKLTKYALLIRCTMGSGSVFMKDWVKAVKYFIYNNPATNSLVWDEQSWFDCLKVIEGTFVLSQPYNGDYVVNFHNPSVFDFLVTWLNESPELQGQLIEHSYFCEQLYRIFSGKEYASKFGCHLIKLRYEHYHIMAKAIRNHFSMLNSCGLRESTCGYYRNGRKVYYLDRVDTLEYFLKIRCAFEEVFNENSELYFLVSQQMLENASYSLLDRASIIDTMPAATQDKFDMEEIARKILEQAEFLDDYINIVPFLQKTQTGTQRLQEKEFVEKINDSIETELYNASSFEECERINEAVEVLEKIFPHYGFDSWESEIYEKQSQYVAEPTDDDFPDEVVPHKDVDNFDEMFTSLLCCY